MDEARYIAVEDEQQEVSDKLTGLEEGVEDIHADDLGVIQDNLFDILLEYQASVNVITQEENLCGICEQRHLTIKCRLLLEQNITPYSYTALYLAISCQTKV